MVTSASHAATVAGPARAASGRRRDRARGADWPVLAAVAALTVVAAVLRVIVAHQSLFGDELSTWWIVTTNDLPGVVSIVHDRIEITPPLYFVLAEIATQVSESPEWLRAPSLLVGTAAVPLVYCVGARTVGRAAGLVAAALTALAPFMIFYGSEARGYHLMVVLVMLSTLALLTGVERANGRWWVAYAACSAAAAYSHYTCVFALGVQLIWVLWAHPEARRAVLLANVAAVVGFLPWLTGFVDDLNMPDSRIMSDFSPLTWHTARLALEHWSVGYPYIVSTSELRDIPGVAGLSLQALGLAIGAAGAALAAYRRRSAGRPGRVDRRVVLVVALALAAPVGEAAATLFGTNLIAARNLSVSWPWFALALAAVLLAAGPRLRVLAAALVIAGFAIGAAKMTQADFSRPDFAGAAAIVDREAGPRDGIVDGAVAFITPGPLTGLDAALERPHRRLLRAGAPQHRDGNFRIGDLILPHEEVIRRATAGGGKVFVLYPEDEFTPSARLWDPLLEAGPGYERTSTRILPGFIPLAVHVYER
jgi:hypothetical protein